MPIRPLLAFAAALLLVVPANAADCPVERSRDKLSEAIEKAPTCAYVASIDSMFGAIVTEKCEMDFLGELSATQRKTYEREMDACTRKYANTEGTMYVSFTAMCHSRLAAGYSKKFSASK